jgi:hypothetical protein
VGRGVRRAPHERVRSATAALPGCAACTASGRRAATLRQSEANPLANRRHANGPSSSFVTGRRVSSACPARIPCVAKRPGGERRRAAMSSCREPCRDPVGRGAVGRGAKAPRRGGVLTGPPKVRASVARRPLPAGAGPAQAVSRRDHEERRTGHCGRRHERRQNPHGRRHRRNPL